MELNYLLMWGVIIFLFNIPFGFLRTKHKTFSLKWFLYIHLPVLIIILIRLLFKIPPSSISIAIFFISFFMGQYIGKKISHAKLFN